MTQRTIDNLGYEAYKRYAVDQQLLENSQLLQQKETHGVFGHTQIDVTTPSFTSEVDLLLASKKNHTWAEFSPPIGYTEPHKRFFTHQLFPTLSIQEKNALFLERIESQVTAPKNADHRDANHQDEEKNRQDWERAKEQEEENKEKETLLTLLDCILNLDSCMLYVNSKREQYHKG